MDALEETEASGTCGAENWRRERRRRESSRFRSPSRNPQILFLNPEICKEGKEWLRSYELGNSQSFHRYGRDSGAGQSEWRGLRRAVHWEEA